MTLGNLLKATRINRTIPSLLLITLTAIITQKINLNIFLLGIILILIYSSGGLQNVIKDKDFKLNKNTKFIIIALILTAITISFNNKYLIISTVLWIILSLLYNFTSRKILLLDTTILCITHYFIPTFFSLLMLNQGITQSLKISIPIYLIFWFITPTKNLKEIRKDKLLKYRTIPTQFKNGKTITLIILNITIIPIILTYFILDISNYILLTIPNIILFLSILNILFIKNQEKKALKTTRLFFSYLILNLIILKWLI